MGMLLAQPLRTPMKWSLKVPIDFLAKLFQWSSGGTSTYVIFDTNQSNIVVDSMANFIQAELGCAGFGALALLIAFAFVQVLAFVRQRASPLSDF
jgi:hypothetical protein